MIDYAKARDFMVRDSIIPRGVRDNLVLEAMRRVPREKFLPPKLRALAYEDRPLPIGSGQTISQPYIVAYMIEALALRGGEKVLEIGAGSGYAAAVLGEIAGEVFAIERIGQLAEKAAINLMDAGYDNVHIRHDDGTKGWAELAPFDAILVSAGAPDIPKDLLDQLAVSGRMLIPVGSRTTMQELVRVTRIDEDHYDREDLADVRFVPLIGELGCECEDEVALEHPARFTPRRTTVKESVSGLISQAGQGFEDWNTADIQPVVDRAGDARVVLIGEASHGTSEFYSMRARITRKLIEEKGFNIVAVEGDWPDIKRIDHYVRHADVPEQEWSAFARFPTWMWRNEEVHDFIAWLHDHNQKRAPVERAAFYGLDLYSLYNSVCSVTSYLDDVDPDLAAIARIRYGCLSPWEADPAAYGYAALTRTYRDCESDVVAMLVDLLKKQQEDSCMVDESLFDAIQNAELIKNAEKYYRIMYYGSRASWNLRDRHMFETLGRALDHHGANAKAIVWAHNSHIGDALATEMSSRGEHNLGQLCREVFDQDAYNIGFGTDHGTVAAASRWDGPMEIKKLRPSHPQSYEHQFHLTNQPGVILPLAGQGVHKCREALSRPHLERAIGVIYRPETELASHYFEAVLPRQFDEYIFIDRTHAVKPLKVKELEGLPDTYPFGI